MRGQLWDRMTFGPWRRRRWMLRQLRRLDELDAREARAAADRRRPRRSVAQPFRTAVVVCATTAIVVVGLGVLLHREYGLTLTADGLRGPTPLSRPPEVTPGVGSHAFAMTQPGDGSRPVTYSPCREVAVVVNDALAPPGSAGLVEEALAEVSAATGLRLVLEGTTDEPAAERRELRIPERYGDRWAPALVAWTTPEEVPGLRGDVAGLGGSSAFELGVLGRLRYVSGTVHLDAPAMATILARPDGRDLARAVVMHELAHLVGLDHVDDPGELMYADNVGVTGFGPGDREGLAALGSGDCL